MLNPGLNSVFLQRGGVESRFDFQPTQCPGEAAEQLTRRVSEGERLGGLNSRCDRISAALPLQSLRRFPSLTRRASSFEALPRWLFVRGLLGAVLVLAILGCLAARGFAAEKDLAVEWKFDSGNGGWKAVNDCTLSVQGGHLIVESTGDDPHFTNATKAPAGWKRLRIRAKFKGVLNGQVFWSEPGKDGFSEDRSVTYVSSGKDGSQRSIDVFFNAAAPVTGLRIDPDNKKTLVEFISIELFNQAPPAPKATPVEAIKMKAGFKAELIYSVPTEQGSWVSLCVDPKGRLITSDQYGKLYRITPPAVGTSGPPKIEVIPVESGMAHGLLWAFDSLYVVTNGPGKGLYRIRDTNNDDVLDEVKQLRAFEGPVSEHGPHAVILSPDKKSIYVCAGNHTLLPKPERSRLPRNWDEDQLLPRMWDAGGHAVGIMAPGGWIAKTDPEGNSFELVTAGFRNQYDIAFNVEGDLFTYDADMEWDINTPWYRPTRVNHAVSGGEFGWRSGSGKWPEFYPDSLGSVIDIGPGSPTGISFGYGARFPHKDQQALFISDWSYGVIYAVHLKPQGASYVAEMERFAAAAPLPATDIVISPVDGAMYFTIGGRRTQSGLYRVTYTGPETTTAFPPEPPAQPAFDLRVLRRQLEALHEPGHGSEKNLAFIWSNLSHVDRHIRYAARIALEFIPAGQWQARIVTEKNPDALMTSAIAAARNADSSVQADVTQALSKLDWTALSEFQQLSLLRTYGLLSIRLGPFNPASKQLVLAQIDRQFPAMTEPLNRELARLLIALEAPKVIDRSLALMSHAPTQEEQMHYAYCLRAAQRGWTLPQREQYFGWFIKAAELRGGHSLSGFVKNIRQEAIDQLTESEKTALAATLAKVPMLTDAPIVEVRQVVKKYSVQELLPQVALKQPGRDFERGRKMFAQGACFKCHRMAGAGGTVGPDLTSISGRFNDLSLLESLIEPSKVVSDQYEATTFVLESGKSVTGRIINLNGDNYLVSENMLDPGRLTPVNRREVEELLPSKISMMPTGLIDSLTTEEILDLVAYLRSGGNPNHELFKK